MGSELIPRLDSQQRQKHNQKEIIYWWKTRNRKKRSEEDFEPRLHAIKLMLPAASLDSPTYHRNLTSISDSGLLFLQNRMLSCLCFAGLWMLVSVTMKLHVISSDYTKIVRICKEHI